MRRRMKVKLSDNIIGWCGTESERKERVQCVHTRCTTTTNYNLQIKRALSTINLHLIRAAHVLFRSIDFVVSFRRIATDAMWTEYVWRCRFATSPTYILHKFRCHFYIVPTSQLGDPNETKTPNAHRNDVYFSIITTHQEHWTWQFTSCVVVGWAIERARTRNNHIRVHILD